jgi:predicted nucleic acid-binding protein
MKWELPGEDYATEALEVFHDWQAGVVLLHSPDLLTSEIGSAFLRALRRGRVTLAQSQAGIQGLLQIAYVLHPSEWLVQRAFEIAHQYNQRIYDCFYVALAEREGIDFWTGDMRIYNALRIHFPFIRFIADYTPLRPVP